MDGAVVGALKTCTIEGCGKPRKGRGWCAMHYRRWTLTGDPGPADSLRVPGEITACSVDECDTPKRSSGALYCEMHYGRMRRNGTLEGPRRYDNEICSVDGCSTPRKSNGMCDLHDTRYRRHGDPNTVIAPEQRRLATGALSPSWTGSEATYNAAHQRVKKARGSARKHPCVDCGNEARHWSYDHADPNERFTEDGYAYSTELEHYEPRCVPCHKLYDLALLASKREAAS